MAYICSTEKIAQVVGVLLRQEPHHTTEYLRVLKMLYIADRESIKEIGRPIIGSQAVAMEHGPLHSKAYDLIKGNHKDAALWFKYFDTERWFIKMNSETDVSELSRYEVTKLEEISKRYYHYDEWQLSKLTHDFVEWERNYKEDSRSSFPIPFEEIIEAVGISEHKDQLLAEQEVHNIAQRIFGKVDH